MRLTCVVFLLLAAVSPRPAAAAESYDGCRHFITALPAVIDAQGTWCLQGDLSATEEAFAQVQVNANNVTLDCNDHLIDGTPLGPASASNGVYMPSGVNLTIRRCHVRGFDFGLWLFGDGVVVEHNRLQGNRARGVYLQGEGNTVRYNTILDTGLAETGILWAMGMSTYGDIDIHDNLVDGATATAGSGQNAWGIIAADGISGSSRVSIVRNRVRGIVAAAGAQATGISVPAQGGMVVRDNLVFGPGDGHLGIYCQYASTPSHVAGNIVLGASMPVVGCSDDGDNSSKP